MKTYIIVEKEVATTKSIRTVIDEFDDLRFIGAANDQNEALHLIFKTYPDIVFLGLDDVVDNLSGFLLDITKHSENDPVFIALSRSKELAYMAYQYGLFDYLLKPLTELDIERCLLKYRKEFMECN